MLWHRLVVGHNPEDLDLNLIRQENLKSCNFPKIRLNVILPSIPRSSSGLLPSGLPIKTL